jgi:hypothetical protein
LTSLFGPETGRAEVPPKGLSAAQLARLAGCCRSSSAPADIESLEALGLMRRVKVGKRERFIPIDDCPLARSLCELLESVERARPARPDR